MNKKALIDTLKGIFWGCLVCALLWMLFGCSSTRYVTVPKYHEKLVTKTDSFLSHDSIYLHDSVMCVVRGDSVFTDRWHTKYIEKLKYISHNDTICQRDSIAVPVEVVKYKTKHDGYLVAFGLALAIGLYAYIRRRL